jgi:hypothetical protein
LYVNLVEDYKILYNIMDSFLNEGKAGDSDGKKHRSGRSGDSDSVAGAG